MNKKQFLIDAHAHIQDCYNIKDYFYSVYKNFSDIANRENISNGWIGVLFLTEVKELNFFNKLKSEGIKKSLEENDFCLTKTLEDSSIILSDKNERKLIIIAGKQIITENNIEVLALGTSIDIEYGNSLESTIDQVLNTGAIPVLPWGVGKWLGKRKEILLEYIKSNNSKKFFLGDNGGRPIFWSTPKIFSIGTQFNHFVLPGSDALAISSEYNKTGSFGFSLESEIDLKKPSESLKNSIQNMEKQPKIFGKLESPFKFLSNQIKMQLRKHI